jgi:hypothetical protein
MIHCWFVLILLTMRIAGQSSVLSATIKIAISIHSDLRQLSACRLRHLPAAMAALLIASVAVYAPFNHLTI